MTYQICCAEFIDHEAGGNLKQRLQKVSEFEVTSPSRGHRLVMTAEVGTLLWLLEV